MSRLKIELTELKRISDRSHTIEEELNSDLNNMSRLLEEICENVNSSELTGANRNLVQSINDIAQKVNANFPEINNFLDRQIAGYTENNENAKSAIETLVSSIDETFKMN